MADETEELNTDQSEDQQQVDQEQQDDTPEPIANLAREMGWVPKEDFKGPEDAWKPADQFIRDGRDIQRQSAQELKALRQQMDTIARTNATIVEQTVNERMAKLGEEYNRRVEDGDAAGAFQVAEQISVLRQQPAHVPNAPPPEAQTFAQRNANWFQKDPLATATAIEVTNRLAAQGYDTATQLDAAEKEVRRLYPQLFGMNGTQKAAPGVHSPQSRAPRSDSPNRQRGFADLPPEAQRIANDMVERKVIPDKDAYARNYFANEVAAKGRTAARR